MDQSPIRALSERIASTLPADRTRRGTVLRELKSLRQRMSPQAPKDRIDRLDAAVLLLEFMATVETAVTSDALSVVARLVATLESHDLGEPVPEPAAPQPSTRHSAPQVGFPAEDLRLSFSMLLGQILLEAGVVTIDGVGDALRMQLRTGRPLGSCLVELGLASEQHVLNALRVQDELRGKVQKASGTATELGGAQPGQEPVSPPRRVPDFSSEPQPSYSAPEQAQRPQALSELNLAGNSRQYVNSAMSFLLGEILVRQGSIQRKDLNRALSFQRASGRFLGETLVEIGAATWDQVKTGLRLQKELR